MSHVTPRRVLLGGALFVALLVAALWWRAVAVTRRLLREDAPASIAEKSENVYRVAVGRVGFNPLSRRLSVDTITVTTNDSVNAARRVPRTGLRLSFRDCAMSGVRVLKLIFHQGLDAETFGCAAVRAAVDVPRGTADAPAAPDSSPVQVPERAFFELQRSLRLPASAPQVRVRRIDFPQVALDFRLARARLQLERLRWLMTGFLVDPADSTAAARPLFSDSVEIGAAHFVGQLDSVTAIT